MRRISLGPLNDAHIGDGGEWYRYLAAGIHDEAAQFLRAESIPFSESYENADVALAGAKISCNFPLHLVAHQLGDGSQFEPVLGESVAIVYDLQLRVADLQRRPHIFETADCRHRGDGFLAEPA